MFICQALGIVTKPGQGMNKVTVETRPKTYVHPPRRRRDEERITEGHEIVKEAAFCDEAYRLWKEGKLIYEHGRFKRVD